MDEKLIERLHDVVCEIVGAPGNWSTKKQQIAEHMAPEASWEEFISWFEPTEEKE